MVQFEEIVQDAIRNNRRIIKVYFDLRTGKSLEGRKLDTVVEEIKAGLYRLVSVYKWNRWGRNTLESLQMCAAVDGAGGQVVSATEAFDTRTPTGEFIRDMLLAQAAWQSRIIGENWRGAQRLRRNAGLPHTGRERFGYVYSSRHYTTDPGEAALVKSAYQRYVNGISLKQIVREWNAMGIVTTMGGQWTPQALGKMLDTGFAAGYIRERSKPGQKPANRIINYDIWQPGTHDAIINEDVWQQYRAKREAQAQLPVRLRSAAHPLSGLIFCGDCGRRMNTKYMGVKKRHNWVCSHRASYHPEISIGISNEIAMEVVRKWVHERASTDDALADERPASVTEKARRQEAGELSIKSNADECLARLARVKTKRDRLRKLYLDGDDKDLTEAKYKKILTEFEAEEREFRTELSRARAAEKAANPADLLAEFVSLDQSWNKLLLVPVTFHRLLQAVIGMVRVFPRESARLSESANRVDVVSSWEMEDWGDAWLAERRRWQISR